MADDLPICGSKYVQAARERKAADVRVMDRGSVAVGTLVDALALVYAEGYNRTAPEAVAKICDMELDRRGELLGRVRDRAHEFTQARRLGLAHDSRLCQGGIHTADVCGPDRPQPAQG